MPLGCVPDNSRALWLPMPTQMSICCCAAQNLVWTRNEFIGELLHYWNAIPEVDNTSARYFNRLLPNLTKFWTVTQQALELTTFFPHQNLIIYLPQSQLLCIAILSTRVFTPTLTNAECWAAIVIMRNPSLILLVPQPLSWAPVTEFDLRMPSYESFTTGLTVDNYPHSFSRHTLPSNMLLNDNVTVINVSSGHQSFHLTFAFHLLCLDCSLITSTLDPASSTISDQKRVDHL